MSRDDDIKRQRDTRIRAGVPEKIPAEKRGLITCPFCEGNCGRYIKLPHKPNTNIYKSCGTCNGRGELDPVKLEEEYRASIKR